jgi:hypothetical protein
MALIGAHLMNIGAVDWSIRESVHRPSVLIPGFGPFYGTGVYACYVDYVPREFRNAPFIVFEPLPLRGWLELRQVIVPGIVSPGESPPAMRRFFLLPGGAGEPISSLGLHELSAALA